MLGERVIIKRRVVQRLSPLFPNYLFVRITDDDWRFLLGTFGVQRPLLDAYGPAKIPDEVIDKIKATEEAGLVVLPDKGPAFVFGQRVKVFLPGDKVEIGIYQGQTAKEREHVLLNILGRKTRVEVGTNQIEAAA